MKRRKGNCSLVGTSRETRASFFLNALERKKRRKGNWGVLYSLGVVFFGWFNSLFGTAAPDRVFPIWQCNTR